MFEVKHMLNQFAQSERYPGKRKHLLKVSLCCVSIHSLPECSHLCFTSQTGTGSFTEIIREIDLELKGT